MRLCHIGIGDRFSSFSLHWRGCLCRGEHSCRQEVDNAAFTLVECGTVVALESAVFAVLFDLFTVGVATTCMQVVWVSSFLVPGDGIKQLTAMSIVVTSVVPFGRVGHFGTGLCASGMLRGMLMLR